MAFTSTKYEIILEDVVAGDKWVLGYTARHSFSGMIDNVLANGRHEAIIVRLGLEDSAMRKAKLHGSTGLMLLDKEGKDRLWVGFSGRTEVDVRRLESGQPDHAGGLGILPWAPKRGEG